MIENICCPNCQSKNFIKSGLTSKTKKQTYRCKGCNRRFMEETGFKVDSNTQVNDYSDTEITDRFAKYCKDYNLDISKVKSYKFVNHQGQEAFNVVFYEEDKKEQTREEFYLRLKEEILREISPIKIHKKNVNIERGFFVWSSDKHVGAYTPETSIYPNEYNEIVFRDRLFKVLDEIGYNSIIYGRFDKIVFVDLGDPLDGYDGQTARKHHKLQQNMTNEEQFDTYFKVHKEFFDTLVAMDVCNSIRFEAVSEDNHSASFGFCANRALEIYLNAKYPQIETKITRKFIDHFSYGKHTFMYSHGKDREDLKHGFPLILDPKTEGLINDYITAKELKGFLHFIKGDLHQSAEQYGKRFRYKNVLSLYGASKYIQNNYGNNMAGINYEIIDKFAPKVNSMIHIF